MVVDARQLRCVESCRGQWFGIETDRVLTVKCMCSVRTDSPTEILVENSAVVDSYQQWWINLGRRC